MRNIVPFGSLFMVGLFLLSLFTSCVSKKKYLAEVGRRAVCDTTLQQLNTRNLQLNRELAQTRLNLAEKTGERNAFRELLDKQDDQINSLENQITSLTTQSIDQQSVMDGALLQKTRELENRKAQIQAFKGELAKREKEVSDVLDKINVSLSEYENQGIEFQLYKEKGYIRLPEKLLFRKGTTRLNSKSIEILDLIASVLVDYPTLQIAVVGHSDNKQGKSSNWNISTNRATAVVKALTEDIGFSPNQIIASGKSEFKPIASNETPEGREANRRTEIIISPFYGQLFKDIKEAN